MKAILIFAGTTEGRQIAEIAKECEVTTYVSVATEYGKLCAGEFYRDHVLVGRMDVTDIGRFINENQIELVIDATHPFATLATAHISQACEKQNIRYLRCLRQSTKEIDEKAEGEIIWVDSVEGATSYLSETTGNILVATGSKELSLFTKLSNYRKRCFVRVLSTEESIREGLRLGFEGKNLIAMQGSFSKEMNLATLQQTQAAFFVTKESGTAGGFMEKVWAAKQVGAKLVVIERPKEEGLSVEEICDFLRKQY